MPDDLLSVLTRFHREVFIPDVQRIIEDEIGRNIEALRNDMNSRFDALYQHLNRLESEYHAAAELEAQL